MGSTAAEVQDIIRQLERTDGVTVTQNGDGHYSIRKGEHALSLAATPSDHRWKKNLRASLRRAGIELGARTPRQQARERDDLLVNALMARKYTVIELTKLLREAGERITESGVRARLYRLEARGVIFRANGATQGKEIHWRARSAVPVMPKSRPEPETVTEPLPPVVASNGSSNGHSHVTSNFDLARGWATLTVSIEGPLEEILSRLAPLVSSGRAV